jgi:hypothetical protein
MAPLLTLVVIGIGVAIMVGAVRLRTLPVLFLLLLVGTALLSAAVPVVGTLIQTGWHLAQGHPLWLRFVISVLLGITALRLVLSLLLGWRAADEVAADLTTDLIRWAVRVVLYPVRLGGAAFPDVFLAMGREVQGLFPSNSTIAVHSPVIRGNNHG